MRGLYSRLLVVSKLYVQVGVGWQSTSDREERVDRCREQLGASQSPDPRCELTAPLQDFTESHNITNAFHFPDTTYTPWYRAGYHLILPKPNAMKMPQSQNALHLPAVPCTYVWLTSTNFPYLGRR
jgi:hypothetical protein